MNFGTLWAKEVLFGDVDPLDPGHTVFVVDPGAHIATDDLSLLVTNPAVEIISTVLKIGFSQSSEIHFAGHKKVGVYR